MITLHQVTKIYKVRDGHRTILDKIDLQVRRGEKIGILGRNGSGKSTMIRLIGGTEPATSGTVVRTMNVSWPLAFAGGFQGSLSGLDNLRFLCRVYDAPIDPARVFVEEFAELGRYLREPVKNYSGGMRARLAFALSMAIEFDCFLIDEVNGVGDQRFQVKCHEELFVKRQDRAMIMVSHNPDFIKTHCERAAVLVQGKLYHFASVDKAFEFYSEHDSE